ncbi:MAG TPA: hypothetical protein VJ761_19130 [Ktedonobacteraceae bacterium]|nr:hypothetical protein [Ktedonobacteraceae bacterium]
MEWLNNAYIITGLVMAIFGICGYLYGIVTFLKKKATPVHQGTIELSQTSKNTMQRTSVSYKPFSWLEWIEFFAQGFVDTASFILGLFFQDELKVGEDEAVMGKLGLCSFICFMGALLGGVILGVIIGAILSGLGVPNGMNIGGVIAVILLFALFSLVYIYHVGLKVEKKRQEQYQQIQQQEIIH